MRMILVVTLVMAAVPLSGCGIGATTFTHPDYNFAFVDRVAVIPFENLSEDRGAAARMTRYFVSELLEVGVFEVVEPGEVTEAMHGIGSVRVAELTGSQIVDLGRQLDAQALFLGSVTESSTIRSGSTSESVVTIDVRMVETETGVVIWQTTLTETGRGFWSSLFGTTGATMGQVSRSAARAAVGNLVD